jgi:UDP-GlcNAc:undecaprenyl-phosphate GlcNAc-1-phosphate transferase
VSFPTNVYSMALVSGAVTAFVTLPAWRSLCFRIGLVDEPGNRKIHDEPVPLAGGLAVMTGLLLPTILACLALLLLRHAGKSPNIPSMTPDSPNQNSGGGGLIDPYSAFLLRYGLGRRAVELTGIFLGALGMLWVGLLDDKRELSPPAKFTGQALVAFLVAASGARITLFVPNILFSYLITMLWILTVINAFNFMDNMNGLCAGLGAIGAWYFAIIAATHDQYLVALIAFLTLGALLGFLPHNFPRARAFLGDAGSHLVGYLLAVLAILPHFYTRRHPNHLAVLIPLVVLAVPLCDLAWVVLLRWRIGQPFYQGDTNHLSHRLVRRGFTRTQAVLLIWMAAAMLGSLVTLY